MRTGKIKARGQMHPTKKMIFILSSSFKVLSLIEAFGVKGEEFMSGEHCTRNLVRDTRTLVCATKVNLSRCMYIYNGKVWVEPECV